VVVELDEVRNGVTTGRKSLDEGEDATVDVA
jgi:hypothetical protein